MRRDASRICAEARRIKSGRQRFMDVSVLSRNWQTTSPLQRIFPLSGDQMCKRRPAVGLNCKAFEAAALRVLSQMSTPVTRMRFDDAASWL